MTTVSLERPSLLVRTLEQTKRTLCGLFTEHQSSVLTFDDGRMATRCIRCGYVSPGWDVKSQQPTVLNSKINQTRRIVTMPRIAG